MARGSKAKYTTKQKRQAAEIEKSYERRGVSKKTAESRAWATVNKQDGGGRKAGGSGRGAREKPAAPLRKGSRVSWRWARGGAIGRVLEVFRQRITRVIRGKAITRKATPQEPALLVETEAGREALKSARQLRRVSGRR